MRSIHRRAVVRAGLRFAIAASLATACARGSQAEMEEEPRPEPIPVRVRNENFLDMNVSYVSGGVARRLGQVSGNGSAEFRISANVSNGQSVSILAVPIGQNSRYTSPGLSVRSGQTIEVRLASVLRQSTTVVRN